MIGRRLEALREASGGRVIVGVSGKDSLVVLHLLASRGFTVLSEIVRAQLEAERGA